MDIVHGGSPRRRRGTRPSTIGFTVLVLVATACSSSSPPSPAPTPTPQTLAQALVGARIETGAPGQYFFSYTDYVALGAVIEQASGMEVDAFFKQLVAAPLGLDRCLFDMDPALAPDVAHGFAFDSARSEYHSVFPADGSVPTHLWGPVWTDHGIMCAARDAALFADALFRGQLSRPETLASMTSFTTEGYGLGVARKTDSARPLYGHAGLGAGFGAAAWYDPELRLTIVALVNADGPGLLAATVFERMDHAYAGEARP